MASSSDDEGDPVPHAVLNYHFVDAKDEPVSFSMLPIHWTNEGANNDGDENLNGDSSTSVFLHGTSHDGLQTIYKQVTAWKFDLSYVNPEISVYSKDKKWIKLVKPRKSFEVVLRSVLITVHFLHFLKRQPEASKKALWDNLAKVFSSYDVRPSENDLVDNLTLITEASKRDESLRKSEVLCSFLKEKPKKRKNLDEVAPTASMSGFIVDDTDDVAEGIEEDESEEEDYDSVCAFCDNGGELLCCEGSCMRSFHPTVESGSESLCVSLGLNPEQVEGMPTFYCPNCQKQKHQCFACGKLGSSNKSAGAEVFRCVKATCGRFYHPKCVSKLLQREDEAAAQQLEGEISIGKSFTCPVHRCFVCKMEENKKDVDLQFAVCRRCPKSYHRKCLPRKIGFEDDEDNGIELRAWEGLLPNRILIYCLKHVIDEEIGTPERNHIKFDTVEERKKKLVSKVQSSSSRERFMSSRKSLNSANSHVNANAKARPMAKSTPSAHRMSSVPNTVNKTTGTGVPKRFARGPVTRVPERFGKTSAAGGNKMSLGDQLFDYYSKAGLQEEPVVDKAEAQTPQIPEFKLDAESENRIKDIVKAATSAVTMEKILERHKGPSASTHSYFSRETFDKNITQGKVDAAVEAVRSALEKLESGASVQEAKDICEPRVLSNIVKWKDKLKVYLAPFLHGMRYTSFGRHFTKVDKLEQIVDRLHWYVQSGDMIVDFCCGSNDFSCILKRKLEETGKKCSFKNFDIIQAKNDFNFVQKDWFEVTASELAPGSQLIMGLNPPFGVKASLANKFIDKALEFNPKLLILIVPPETQRLDEKKKQYDLIWEDSELLSGKAFYLPGSVDENNKQLDDWNVTTPPLYLWSRQDWTNSVKEIAEKHGHLSRNPNLFRGQESNKPQISAQVPPPIRVEELEEPASREVMANQGIRKPSPHSQGGYKDGRKENRDVPTNVQGRGQSVEGTRDLLLKKDSSDISPRSFNSLGRHEKKNANQDHYKAQSEEPRGTEQQNNGRHVRSDRLMSDHNPRLDRSLSERQPPPSDHRSTSECYSPGYERELSRQTHHSFQPDISGSGEPGFGAMDMDTDITNDITRLYSYNDRVFSPGPDGLGYPYVNEINGRESGMRSLIQDYGRPESGTRSLIQDYGRPESEMRSLIQEYGRPESEMRSLIQNYGRPESEMRSLIQNYGRQDPGPFMNNDNFIPNHNPGYNNFSSLPSAAYNDFGPSAADAPYSRLNTSAMERYAPRLDELNHPRANNVGMDIHPPLGTGSGIYDPRAREQQHTQPRGGPRPGAPGGFAYGLPQSFAKSSSSGGWIND